jgi:catechol 2,3-dioxygenase-like lactoylglutathione lyase family enzyme
MATVRYLVDDVGPCVAFYLEALGFEEIERYGPAISILRRGDLDLWLAGPISSAARPLRDGRQPEPGGWNRIVITTDDLVGLIERLRDAGTTVRNDIVEGPGGTQILIEDPAGNPIELFQRA